MTLVYDTAVLIAADREDRRVMARHRQALAADLTPRVPAGVLAQAYRSARQSRLRFVVKACEVVPMDEVRAMRLGLLLAKSKTSDVVDASVVDAAGPDGVIVTGDVKDIKKIADANGLRPKIEPV